MNFYDHAHSLARALKTSPQLKRYREAKEKLENEPSAKEMLFDFQKAQFEMQKQQISGLEVSDEQKNRLSKLYEVINLNVTVKEFLGAENQLLVMIQDIYKIIGEPLADVLEREIPWGEDGDKPESS